MQNDFLTCLLISNHFKLFKNNMFIGISVADICWYELGLGFWGYGYFTPLSTKFNYIMVVSFIGAGNWSTQRKPLTCRKSLTNFITQCCIKYTSPWAGFELTSLVVMGTDCTGSCKSNYHTITTMMAPKLIWTSFIYFRNNTLFWMLPWDLRRW